MSVSSIPSATVTTDLKGLDQLKHTVKGDSIDDLRVAAKQFEAIFIQQMLKTMRDASLAEGMFDSSEGDYYLELLDKQLSLNMSEGRGIGLADIIVQQLSRSLKLENIDSIETKEAEKNVNSLQLQNVTGGPGIPDNEETFNEETLPPTMRQMKQHSHKGSENHKLSHQPILLSGIQDLGYTEAVSRLNLQLVGLQASQQAITRIQNLSLFNYL